MLQEAAYGYAMVNGSATAKLAASYITKHTNENDGVAKTLDYIEKLIHRNICKVATHGAIDELERGKKK